MWTRRLGRTVRATWGPSRVRRIARQRTTWLLLAAALAVMSLTQIQGRLSAAETERAAWGETVEVAVVVRAVAAGDDLAGSVELRELPRAMVPDGAATSTADGYAKVALFPGEAVLGSRITGTPGRGLPEGTAAITVAIAGSAPLVEPGDLVDLWSVDSATQTSRQVGSRLAVLARTGDDLTVAVPVAQVALATVAALRPVLVVLVG